MMTVQGMEKILIQRIVPDTTSAHAVWMINGLKLFSIARMAYGSIQSSCIATSPKT